MDNHLRGEGPFYLDCTVGSEYENEYVVWSWIHEGKGWLFIRHMEEEGYDLNRDRIEFTMNNAQMGGGPAAGVLVDSNLDTGVGGLYVAGDEMGGFPWASSQVAVGTGWFTGSMAAEFAKKEGEFQPVDDDRLELLIERCTKIRDNETGVPWKEVERSVQDIVDTYRGDIVTDQTLKRGIERIHDVRDNVYLKADNPHELMRCLEAQSLIQNAEYVLRASVERKETRILPLQFIRTDYPEQDDENFHAWIVMTLEDGEFKFAKIPASEINPG
jgi:succinate dehydrogenase/fumarate reductase flavoprotein subunit